MKTPTSLLSLIEDGIIDRVLRQLQSGKEAAVFMVECGGNIRCAKVYKDIEQRSFHNLAQYQEGRRSRGSRNARATGKRSRHGQKVRQAEWKSAEVNALYKLQDVGVRVPRPYGMFEGVLLMELVQGADGLPAPRLNEVAMSPEQALEWHAFMIQQIACMLFAGLIHGDLSGFNVLIGADGPVIIDLPQVVSAAGNNSAFAMLQRDVINMRSSFGAVAPELLKSRYAPEMWALYKSGALRPDTRLTGQFVDNEYEVDVEAVLDDIEEARLEAEDRARRRAAGLVQDAQ